MKTIKMTILFLLIGFAGIAQTKKLIADETTISQLKASVKVETSNETVFKLICASFKDEGFKYTATIKRDRTGLYTVYAIPFKNDQLPKVLQFFEKINAKTK